MSKNYSTFVRSNGRYNLKLTRLLSTANYESIIRKQTKAGLLLPRTHVGDGHVLRLFFPAKQVSGLADTGLFFYLPNSFYPPPVLNFYPYYIKHATQTLLLRTLRTVPVFIQQECSNLTQNTVSTLLLYSEDTMTFMPSAQAYTPCYFSFILMQESFYCNQLTHS